jgi:dihydrodipicolinate synthase/N-acetylneuraminate lyase
MIILTRAALANDWATARTLHASTSRSCKLISRIESSAGKSSSAMMGKVEEVYRLPLLPMRRDTARACKIAPRSA